MSIEQNKELVRRFVDGGINPADMAIFDEGLAEDVEDHAALPGLPPGREGWKQNRRSFQAAFPDARWEIHDMVAQDDIVVARATFSGTHHGEIFGIPGTGRRVAIGSMHICRVADGMIV